MKGYIALSVSITLLLLPDISWAGRRKLAVIDDQKFQEICGECTGNTSATLRKNGRGRFAILHSTSGELAGYFLITSDYSRPRGYHGATAVGLTLDPEGSILSTRIIESADTKDYVERIEEEGFLEKFLGRLPNSIVEVDAVSGATRTCDAIREAIKNTLSIFNATIVATN
ncbi:MAG: FMN-binding protein [Candidatus Euphemobacter frigidus]|nr:FMN-binding protein [Candidatus Euphemobacter frigidus]MDP8276743.1 FMN-binding protein [Candidatus Euphemobacter frigidus]